MMPLFQNGSPIQYPISRLLGGDLYPAHGILQLVGMREPVPEVDPYLPVVGILRKRLRIVLPVGPYLEISKVPFHVNT
jgi:hypothetical protein